MPPSLTTGGFEDSVRLQLGGDDIFIAQSWEVVESVFSGPSRFSLEIGQSQPVANLFTSQVLPSGVDGQGNIVPSNAARYPKGSPFQLFIGEALQMNGIYEGFHAHGAATQISLRGRDQLSVLMRTHAEAQRSFIDGTYLDLVEWALEASGLTTATVFASNAANRRLKAGIPIDQISDPTTVDEINAAGTAASNSQTSGTLIGGIVSQKHENRIHENLLAFCRRHLDRAGLFLWAGATPNTFILGQPNGAQKPSLRITRKRGASQAASNVRDASFSDGIENRHGVYTIYGRGGGGKAGRTKTFGSYVDPEMNALGNALSNGLQSQGILYRDVNVQNTEQAEFTAQRKACEERRNGWNLSYTVSGHRLPSVDGNSWGVITPDTVVLVEDDEYGINDVYYVETVTRRRSPQTETELRLMRIEDLIFATGGVE
jgi:prophage tail gpP-like protein